MDCRLWKGYRDAQCAWMEHIVEERRLLFLVIYAPRRGLLEVWKMFHGSRVAAVPAPSAGRLLSAGPPLGACQRVMWLFALAQAMNAQGTLLASTHCLAASL